MTNNELSRKVLAALSGKAGRIRFTELVETMGTDARTVFKNLFFLEDKGFVRLATSYPTGAVYPEIHLVRIHEAGEELLNDQALMDSVFPVSDPDSGQASASEADEPGRGTYADALERLARKVRNHMEGEERNAAIEKIESLLRLPFVKEEMEG